jgi:hypothetical protein
MMALAMLPPPMNAMWGVVWVMSGLRVVDVVSSRGGVALSIGELSLFQGGAFAVGSGHGLHPFN